MSAVLTDQFHLSLDLSPLIADNTQLAVLGMYNGSWRIYHLAVQPTVEMDNVDHDDLLDSLNQHRPDTPEPTWFYYIGQIFPVLLGLTSALRFLPINDTKTFDMFRAFTYCCPDCIPLQNLENNSLWYDPGHLAELYAATDHQRAYARYANQCLTMLSSSERHYDEKELIEILAEQLHEPVYLEPEYNTRAL